MNSMKKVLGKHCKYLSGHYCQHPSQAYYEFDGIYGYVKKYNDSYHDRCQIINSKGDCKNFEYSLFYAFLRWLAGKVSL